MCDGGGGGGRGVEHDGESSCMCSCGGVGRAINIDDHPQDMHRPVRPEGAARARRGNLGLVALRFGLVLQELRHRQSGVNTTQNGHMAWVGLGLSKVRSSHALDEPIFTLATRLRSTEAKVVSFFVKKDLTCVSPQAHFGK